jgi:hypothetical protein
MKVLAENEGLYTCIRFRKFTCRAHFSSSRRCHSGRSTVYRCSSSSGQETERDSLQRRHAFDDVAGLSEASALLIEGNVNCTLTPNLTWPIAQDT